MKKGGRDAYIVCEECSKVVGEEVMFHKSLLLKEEGEPPDFDETTTCPKGHRIAVSE